MYKLIFKRTADVFLSLLMLIILALPMLIISLAVKIDSKGPVIFRQTRLGRSGKEFCMYKFRSMCVGAENMAGGVYSDRKDTRVTRVGRFLRATSADELPQLINILKGDMSFIGPRPPLTYHPWKFDEYTEEQKKMFELRPGITGWAQINGRRAIEWNKRIEFNVWYVENLSFALDVKIFFKTIGKVFSNADNENSGATVDSDKADTKTAATQKSGEEDVT